MALKRALVLGAGVAGAEVALNLAEAGLSVVIAEATHQVGGKVAWYCCKATERCQNCSVCLGLDRVGAALRHPGINLKTGCEIIAVRGGRGNYQVTLRETPAAISQELCIGCGRCLDACSEIRRGNPRFSGGVPEIDTERCRMKKGEGCQECVAVCPVKAIDLARPAKDHELEADVIIVATGFEMFHPGEKPHFEYGKIRGVITAKELEEHILTEGISGAMKTYGRPGKIAFVQCVGSRDPHIKKNYCSRTCCSFAMRLAKLIRAASPDTEISIFYIDLQTFGKDFPAYLDEFGKDKKLRLIKAIPARIASAEEGKMKVRYEDMNKGENVEEIFDLLVLSLGQSPGATNRLLADKLGINLNADGFFDAPDPVFKSYTGIEGIFIAGTSREPGSIQQSLLSAETCAAEIISSGGGAH